MQLEDTIAAPATGDAQGSIGIIRLSGKDCKKIVQNLFKRKKNNVWSIEKAEHKKMYFGDWYNKEGVLLDEVMLCYFNGPFSYTGQNTVEIFCHGSPYIKQTILDSLLANGCRMADPGEFTFRAYMNAKMDLSQAEAVADLISSENKASHQIAMQQLRGGFSQELKKLRSDLIDFTALLELELDFPEEDVEFADRKQLLTLLNNLEKNIKKLSDSFHYGNAIKEGIPVAIVGKPNAGKSSLLNSLVNEEKAIVSNVAGTTRDSIEDILVIDGIKFRFIDTAGLRETQDTIEAMGVSRAKAVMGKAKIIIYLFDRKDNTAAEIVGIIKEIQRPDVEIILTENKIDISKGFIKDDYYNLIKEELLDRKIIHNYIGISSKEAKDIEKLKNTIAHILKNELSLNADNLVSNSRHKNALDKSLECILILKKGIKNNLSGDLLSSDLRKTLEYIGSITGEIDMDQDILGAIFGKFCIGK